MVSLKVLNLREDPIGYLAGQTIDDAASTLVVFPTARNIRFFRKTLSGMSGDRTVISPYCLEISRFINQCLDPGGKALVDLRMRPFYLQHGIGRLRREQLAGLFRDSSKKMQEDFFEFAAAGSRILRFLDEIHAEKITADKLTKVSLYTDYEKHINILKDIGDSYRNALEEDGLTDIMFLKMGGAFLLDWLEDFKKVHFLVGGYLTGFELDLIKTIGHKKDVEIIVRYEGEPDKQTKKIFEAFSVDAPSMKSAPFPSAIEIRAFEEAAAQFGFIVHAVEHALRAGIPPDHIVVVLPDENTKRILFSLERKRIFNYAMGLDLKDTVWYSFLKSVEILFAERIGSSQYRSEPVINFLTHPFIRNLPAAGHWIDDFISEIKRENRLILNKSDFCKTEILRDVFSRIKSLVVPEGDACSYGGFLLDIAGFMEELESMLNPEFLQTISRSPEFAESRNAIMTWLYQSATLFHDNELRGAGALICLSYLLRQLSALTYSDVAGGTITVMGMLETRNIAFRAVIIPDMNEEMIPPRNEKEMFLNTAIRERLGIPAARDREGLARHYFMSLIKNAEMVFLSYVERDDRPIRSRFIEEILIQTGHTGDDPEWLRRRSEYEGLVFDCVCPPVGASMTDAIRKDETVLKYIDRMTLTPYKLSTYRRCSYKFYLAHIKNLEEPVEISGALEAMDIGNLLHRALKDVYDSGKQFSDAGRLYEKIREAVTREAEDGYDIIKISPHAAFELDVIMDKMYRFAEMEVERFGEGWRPEMLEYSLKMDLGGVSLSGRVDRIDIREGNGKKHAFVIDYKFANLSGMKSLRYDENFSGFQLPVYRLMLNNSRPDLDIEGIGYYDLKDKFKIVTVTEHGTAEDFRALLEKVIGEIRSADHGFIKTDDLRLCMYCGFATICGRR